MATTTKLVIVYFSRTNGNPATGLGPEIDIWEITPTTNTLVVDDGVMTEVGGGFYKYNFTSYDYTLKYGFLADGEAGGGPNLGAGRYAPGTNASFQDDIACATWEEPSADHLAAGSTGLLQSTTATDAGTAATNSVSILAFVETILKFERNRTRIDKTAKTLTIYDDDGTTPIRVFDLRDSTGALSITEIAERDPQ